MTEGDTQTAEIEEAPTPAIDKGLDLQSLLSTIINLEGQCDKGMENAERREVEKNQKIKLREVRKIASDTETISQEKIERLASKCVLEIKESTRLRIQLQKHEKQLDLVKLERDRANAELSKSKAMRDKLQELCRELQKTNKQVTEASKQRSVEEQQKRLELNDKFAETVKDISNRLEEYSADKIKVIEENCNLREKLKGLLDQFEIQEKQMNKKDLELQLSEARLKEEALGRAVLEQQARNYILQIERMQSTEVELRKQLEANGEKYQEFQELITKSNEIFSKMSKDSEKHVKLVRAMEKKLKSSEAAQRKLKAAAEEASASLAKKTEEFNQLERKKQALESLCRRLQDQRAKDQEPAEGAEGEGWSAQAESQGVQGSSEPGPPTEPSAEDGAAPNDAAPGTD